MFICHSEITRALYGSTATGGGAKNKKSFIKHILQNVDDSFERSKVKMGAAAQAVSAIPGQLLGFEPMNVFTKIPTQTPLSPVTSTPTESLTVNTSIFSPLGSIGSTAGSNPVSPLSPGQASAADAFVDLFNEIFELRDKGNWLRRQAVSLVTQQLFGVTVERRLTENLRALFAEETIAGHLEKLRDTLWPGAVNSVKTDIESSHASRTSATKAASQQQQQQQQQQQSTQNPRTPEQKAKTKADAESKLSSLAPELLGGIVGRQNAKRGAQKLIKMFQNRQLNRQLLYSILDELLLFIMPELETLGVVGTPTL
jgi:hypothetical protein